MPVPWQGHRQRGQPQTQLWSTVHRPPNLPVDIQRGYIGKLVMKVPWRSLKSSPTVLEIHDLYMLVKPKNWRGGYDEEACPVHLVIMVMNVACQFRSGGLEF